MKRTKNFFNKLRLLISGYAAKKQLLCKKNDFCNCEEDLSDLCVSCSDTLRLQKLCIGESQASPQLCTIKVMGTNPSDLEVDINIGTFIVIQSNEPIDSANIGNSIVVLDDTLTPVAGTILYGPPGLTGFGFDNPLGYSENYSVTYTLYGLDGCAITGSLTFTTEPCPSPIADFSADDTTPTTGQLVTFTDLSTESPTSWVRDFGDGTSPTYDLGLGTGYEVLSGSTLTLTTFSPPSIILTGDTGETGMAGVPPIFGTGSDLGAAGLPAALADVGALYNTLKVLPGTAIITPASIGSDDYGSGVGVFTPGVYTTASAIDIALVNPVITLSGDGDYVFVSTGGAITTCAGATIILTNGAQAARVFRVADAAITLGGTNDVKGNFMAGAAITTGNTIIVEGRLLSVGAITIDGTSTILYLPVEQSTEQNPTHVYSTPGTYDVTLTATNICGEDTEIKAGYVVVS